MLLRTPFPSAVSCGDCTGNFSTQSQTRALDKILFGQYSICLHNRLLAAGTLGNGSEATLALAVELLPYVLLPTNLPPTEQV